MLDIIKTGANCFVLYSVSVHGDTYDIHYNGITYPPKAIIAYANIHASGKEIIDIEQNYTSNNSDESNSIKLDRMINLARDRGSTVYTSSKFSNNICIIVSKK